MPNVIEPGAHGMASGHVGSDDRGYGAVQARDQQQGCVKNWSLTELFHIYTLATTPQSVAEWGVF